MKCKKGDILTILYINPRNDKRCLVKCCVTAPSILDIDKTPVALVEHVGIEQTISWNGTGWVFSPLHEY